MLTRPDPPKSGKIVTRPDPTRGSIRPVDNSGLGTKHSLANRDTDRLSSLLPSLTEITSVRNLGFIIDQELNLRHPMYFANRNAQGGGYYQPSWIFVSPSEVFEIFLMGMFSGSRNTTVISLLHDIENQGQTPFCMTFLISGCKHDTIIRIPQTWYILRFNRLIDRLSSLFFLVIKGSTGGPGGKPERSRRTWSLVLRCIYSQLRGLLGDRAYLVTSQRRDDVMLLRRAGQ